MAAYPLDLAANPCAEAEPALSAETLWKRVLRNAGRGGMLNLSISRLRRLHKKNPAKDCGGVV